MAFLEQRMNTRIERGATGGPTNKGRDKVYTKTGRLNQVFSWSAPLHEYDVAHGIKSVADAEELLSMWYVIHFTPYSGLRFRDWRDYTATQANSTLTLISGNDWQMQRAYTFGGITFKRDISKPVTGAVVYDSGGSPCTGTMDTATGIFTVSSGTPFSWAGTFDVPVTFRDNELMSSLDGSAANLMVVPESIILEEIRL